MRGKLSGIAVACLLVASLVVAGATASATTQALAEPSVSIVPDTQEVAAGGTFSVDVVVDSVAFLVKGCEVTITFDADLTATAATGADLLGTAAETMRIGPTIPNGEVSYAVVRSVGNDPAAVAGDFMTIDFDVDAAAAGTYDLTIEATLLDENNDAIPGVVLNHGEVVVPGGVPGEASVSIEPATQDVAAGGTFSVDVAVDSAGLLVKGCEVTVTFDADLTATTATGTDLLGTAAETMRIGPTIPNGEVSYAVVRSVGNDPAAVAGDFMTINFDVNPAAAGAYDLVVEATLLDENNDPIPGVVENDGEVVVPTVGAPSVSIDPATQMVPAGDSFSVDVVVDSKAFLIKGCDITVTFDADLTATDATEYDLLGTAAETLRIGPTIPNGEVSYVVVRMAGNDPAAVAGDLMTIEFEVDAAAAGTYDLIVDATLLDENNDPIPGVVENDGGIVIGVPEFEETFTGTLAKGASAYICTIPAGATELAIDLSTAASPGPDLDLELYDGAILVIGEGGQISSGDPGTFPYEGDDFGYSGYNGGEEYITADGPLGQAYDLQVYAFQAGTYTVDVFYVMPGPDNDPPTITITAPDGAVGVPATITVSATDPSGVAWIWYGVWPDDYVLTGTEADYMQCIAMASGSGNEVILTFTPSLADSYYVAAWAGDMVANWTPDLVPETADWEVT